LEFFENNFTINVNIVKISADPNSIYLRENCIQKIQLPVSVSCWWDWSMSCTLVTVLHDV